MGLCRLEFGKGEAARLPYDEVSKRHDCQADLPRCCAGVDIANDAHSGPHWSHSPLRWVGAQNGVLLLGIVGCWYVCSSHEYARPSLRQIVAHIDARRGEE